MIKIIKKIKDMKCERLISITGMKNALAYHLELNGKIKELKLEVPDGEEVESLIPLFENAAIFEAEATELHGIKFDGNPISGLRLFKAEEIEAEKEGGRK